MSNHVDRFYATVSVVASHGNIKQRLVAAFEEHLLDAISFTLEFPDDSRVERRALR